MSDALPSACRTSGGALPTWAVGHEGWGRRAALLVIVKLMAYCSLAACCLVVRVSRLCVRVSRLHVLGFSVYVAAWQEGERLGFGERFKGF